MQKYMIYIAFFTRNREKVAFGEWYDVEKYSKASDLYADVNARLRGTKGAVEYVICDSEGFAIGSLQEYDSFESILKKLVYYQRADSAGNHEAYIAFCEAIGGSYGAFVDAYQGAYESELDYAWSLVASKGGLDGLPENLRGYFDYKTLAFDLFQCDYIFHHGHVFQL